MFAIYHDFSIYSIGMFAALASPIIHAFLFRRMFNYFINHVGREPVDVYLNFNRGLAIDRVFALSVWLGFAFLSLTVIGLFRWAIALENG